MKTLIVGATGFIGSALVSTFTSKDNLLLSSRDQDDDRYIYLDLYNGNFDHLVNLNFDLAIICASVTSFKKCEDYPSDSYLINVTNTIKLIRLLAEKDVFTVWLSSSSVFDGFTDLEVETSISSPTTVYGYIKSETESLIKNDFNLNSKVAIVRLTKVLDINYGFFSDVLMKLSNKMNIEAYDDILFSPISLSYTCSSLLKIASLKLPGIFHLSGETSISYFKLLKMLAVRLSLPVELIKSQNSSICESILFYYKPLFPVLSMKETFQLTGIKPESFDDFLISFCSNYD